MAYQSHVTTKETVTSGADDVATPTVQHSGFDTEVTLNATSGSPISKFASGIIALSTGAVTIDLTNLTGYGGASVTLNALKVQVFKVKNNGAAAMTFAKGASNGYTGFGSAFSITIPPGGEQTFYGNNAAGAVGGGSKTIDVTGTGAQTFNLTVAAG